MGAGGDKGGWCVSRIGAGDGADEFEWEAETDSGYAEEAGGGDVTEGTCAVLYKGSQPHHHHHDVSKASSIYVAKGNVQVSKKTPAPPDSRAKGQSAEDQRKDLLGQMMVESPFD